MTELIYMVLEDVLKEDPENLFITNLIDSDNWRDYLIDSPQTLLIKEYSDVIVTVSRDKRNMFLSFRMEIYNFKDVLNTLKDNLLQ